MHSTNGADPETAICPSCQSRLTVIYGPRGEALSLNCSQCGAKTFLGSICSYLNQLGTRREFITATLKFVGTATALGAVGTAAGLITTDGYKDFKRKRKESDRANQETQALRLFRNFIGYRTMPIVALPDWTLYPDHNTPIHDIAAQDACFGTFGPGRVKIFKKRELPFLSGVPSVVVGGASSSQFAKIFMEQSVLDKPKRERPEFRHQRAVLPLHWIPISEPSQLPDTKKNPSFVQFGMDDKGQEKALSSRQWGFVRTDKDGRIDDKGYVMSRVDIQDSKELFDKYEGRKLTCFSLRESPILITRIANFVGPGDREDKDDEKKLPPSKWSRVTLIDGATGPATGALKLLLNDPGPLSEAERHIDADGDYQILLMATGISTEHNGIHWASGIEFRGAFPLDLSDDVYLNAYRNAGPHYERWIRSKSFVADVSAGKYIR